MQEADAFAQDITLKVRPPSLDEVGKLKDAARRVATLLQAAACRWF